MRKTSRTNKHRSRERGQAAVFLVLAMGLFLIGSMGFVVDGANLWFHRQSAQTAADAACTAGAMKMLSVAAGATPPDPNWIGTSFQCSGSTSGAPNNGFAPCQYAAFNGYSSSGLQANHAGNDVSVAFPSSFSSIPTCPNGSNLCTAESIAATPYIQVNITDRVQTTFLGLLNGGRTVDVGTQAMCGLSNVLSPVPVLVLNPSQSQTLTGSGNLSVINSAQKAIQVNSVDPGAVNLSGTINLTNSNNGLADFSVAARENESDAGVTLTGSWVSPAGVVSDPFATMDAPQKPAQDCTTGCVSHPPPNMVTDCPANASCDIYTPGYYPAVVNCPSTGTVVAICAEKNGSASGLAVFEPGIYYLDGDFIADNHSCLRPGSGTAGDIGGTLFYLHGASTLNIKPQSGRLRQPPGQGSIFNCADPAYGVQLSSLNCVSNVPPGVTALTGNVLLAPCTGPYGDPLGAGQERGILFFHDRDVQPPTQPSWSSAASFGLVGSLYFHNCSSTTVSGSGANCASTAFTDTLTLSSGANAYILGNIVADQLHLAGGSAITVSLSPKSEHYVLKASLLQ